MTKKYNIIIPYVTEAISSADLEAIANAVHEHDPSAHFRYFEIDKPFPEWVKPKMPIPSVIWAMHTLPIDFSTAFDGPVISNERVEKARQLARLEKGKVSVPAWTMPRRNLKLDREKFGDRVLLKSVSEGASHGRGIFLYNTADVEEEMNGLVSQLSALGKPLPIIQRFIKTGDQPCHFRVLTFMGEPILAHKTTAKDKTPGATPHKVLEISDKATSNKGEVERVFITDTDILDAAKKVAKIFPNRPLLGQDLIKDEKTGEIFVIEVNIGNVWSFSSAGNSRTQRLLGPEAMHAQFGATTVVGKQMIKEAKRRLSIR